MWTCLKCKRVFKTTNQSHSCATYDFDTHFLNKPAIIKETYDQLIEVVGKIGKVHINVLKSAILLKTTSTFLEIKPKKDYLIIAFFLDKEITDFPISKTLQISKNRIVHVVHIEKPDDLTEQIISWLTQSYQLINANKVNKK